VSTSRGSPRPGLGVGELTLALYRPRSRHRPGGCGCGAIRAYPHKLITAAYSQFTPLRQAGRGRGYLKRAERPLSTISGCFGHASTRHFRAALGMALARDRRGERLQIALAVIGDGALTGGMALEAINRCRPPCQGPGLLVVLNDNDMSTHRRWAPSPRYLNRICGLKPAGQFLSAR